MRLSPTIRWPLLTFALLAADLGTKELALQHLAKRPIDLIEGFFQLSLSKNSGIAWSIPIPNAVVIILTPLLLVVFARFFARNKETLGHAGPLAESLIMAGALGNWANRLQLGAVVDFLDFSFWPSFNLADAYLTIGVFLIIVTYGKINRSNF